MGDMLKLDDSHFNKIIKINRKQDSFVLKVMENMDPGSQADFWMALYFHAPANSTMLVDSDRNIHQNWELLDNEVKRDKRTKENISVYIFNFVGYKRHETLKYDGNRVAVSEGCINRILIEECNKNPGIVPKLKDTKGLENKKIMDIPGNEGYSIVSVK